MAEWYPARDAAGRRASRGRKRGRMSEAWSKWEGKVVNGEFQLKRYLSGAEQGAVFLADDLVREFQPAAIKLISSDRSDAENQLSRWRLTQGLSHPHLIRIFRTGRCQLND